MRDDIGEEIREYQFDEAEWTGLAWDGELMWGMDIGRQRIVGFDPEDEEIVEIININGEFVGLTYDGNSFWTCRSADPNQGRDPVIVQIDMEGDVIATVGVRGNLPTAVAFDGENLWYHSVEFREERIMIWQITVDGEHIREIDFSDIFQEFGLSIAWADEHDEGQLWMKTFETGTLYQVNIDGEEPALIQEADMDIAGLSGLEHDGENLWYSSAENGSWYVIDDGVSELTWLRYEPSEGVLDPEGEMDITISVDAEDAIEGTYEAELTIFSNDPENDEITSLVTMEVTGIPELEVTWSEDIGHPEIIDWNAAYPDLFVGFAYEIPVLFRNVGTAALVIDAVECEDEVFRAGESEFVIDPGEAHEAEFIFGSDRAGNHEAEMVIVWNSPDEEDTIIPLHARSSNPPQIEVEPLEIEADFDVEEQIGDFIISVFNGGDAELRFTIEHEIIAEPDRDVDQRSVRSTKNAKIPQRDDIGDVIAEYNLGQVTWLGLAWDGDLMWGLDLDGQRLVGFDPAEEEVVREINLDDQYIGLTFDGEAFWTAAFVFENEGRPNLISRIDLDGNVIASFEAQGFGVLSLTFDGENLWYHDIEFDRERLIIRQVSLEGEPLREVEYRNAIGNIQNISITWVEEHEDGHMWAANWGGNRLYQLNVENETAELIQQTEIVRGEPHQLEHDGENLWYSLFNNPWRVIDDGITELTWLSYEPTEGVIVADAEEEIFVTLDATGLYEGDYAAELHLLSNDPENPDVVVSIFMHVTGVPELGVFWEEEIGYPDQVNWNQAYEDIFTGGSYDIPIWLENIGTASLSIDDISFDHELFTIERTEFEIPPGEGQMVILTFNAEEDGEHQAQMTINWEGQEDVISLAAVSTGTPEIELSAEFIEVGLDIGNITETSITLFNNGAGILRYYIEHELTREPEGMNNANPSGPARDAFGDVINEFQMGRASWSGLAWDGRLMWGIDPERQQMVALNPATDWVEHRINLNSHYRGMAYDGEAFWMGQTDLEEGGTRLCRVNRDGELIATIDLGEESVLGVAFDGENLLYYSDVWRNDEKIVRQITREGEHFGEISLINILEDEETAISIAWVENHTEGNLWVATWETGILYQIDVSGDDPRIIQQTELVHAEIYGLEHDGSNMWYSTNSGVWYVIDDGIAEATWLTYEPESGELEANADIDVIVSMDATDLIEGVYEADMHFYSNDIVNSDLIVEVHVEVSPASVDKEITIPLQFKLSNAYPNPFNSSTTLNYDVPTKALVTINVYDLAGHLISTLTDAEHNAGSFAAVWDGQHQASGIYFARMESVNFSSIKSIAIVR